MAPRSKSGLGQEETNIGNLQKGPLVNMYGPGSVFYLIRKRAKEMEARRKRRNVIPASNYRTGISHKASPVAMALAATRGIIDTATATTVYNHHHSPAGNIRNVTRAILRPIFFYLFVLHFLFSELCYRPIALQKF